MDIYELEQYDETDHDFVNVVKNMNDDETVMLEMQNEEGEPFREADGSLVEVEFPKAELDLFLQLMRESGKTLDELMADALNAAVNAEGDWVDDEVAIALTPETRQTIDQDGNAINLDEN